MLRLKHQKGLGVSIPSPPKTLFLDGLRGLAAVYVLLHHGLLWMHPGYQYGYLKYPQRFGVTGHALLYSFSLFRFGHAAVLFFFVLSGFVIHLRYASRAAAGDPVRQREFGSFIWRRARRLYPPLVVAVMLTWGVDYLGIRLGFAVYSGRTPYPVINQNIGVDHSLRTLLGNLAFLMQTYVPVWGTDSPLWSLKFEWWFYFLYPAFWPLMRKSVAATTVLIAGLFALSFLRDVWPLALLRDVFSCMLIWWLGALLAEVYAGRIGIPFSTISPLALLLPIGVLLGFCGHDLPELVWGLGFTGLIAFGFFVQQRGATLSTLSRLKPLGDCSYTLYVIHAPLVLFAGGWLMARSPTGELPASFLPALGCLAIVPFAYLLHLADERPFTSRARSGTRPLRTSVKRAPELAGIRAARSFRSLEVDDT